MVIPNSIQQHIQATDEKMAKTLLDSPKILKPVMTHLLSGKGKNVRAAILLASAQAFGKINEKVISLACATELLHLSTLVHDDIIDDAEIRRGVTSIQTEFGKKIAVIAGDYLFTKCFQLVSKDNKEHLESFAKAIAVICVGEALQHEYSRNVNLTKLQYYKIITGKTAAMFSMACYGAASTMKVKKPVAETMGRLGYYIGMLFQIVDDCLDYEGDIDTIKKSTQKDLQQGIITYPLIYTLEKMPDLKDNLFELDPAEVVNLVIQCGGIEAAKNDAKRYYGFAVQKLNKIFNGMPGKAEPLQTMLDALYERKV